MNNIQIIHIKRIKLPKKGYDNNWKTPKVVDQDNIVIKEILPTNFTKTSITILNVDGIFYYDEWFSSLFQLLSKEDRIKVISNVNKFLTLHYDKNNELKATLIKLQNKQYLCSNWGIIKFEQDE